MAFGYHSELVSKRRNSSRAVRLARWLTLLIAPLFVWAFGSQSAQAQTPSVVGIRLSGTGASTSVWIEMPTPVDYNVFQLENPPRVVIDFELVEWRFDRNSVQQQVGNVTGVRFGQYSDTKSRLVLDLASDVSVSQTLFEPPHSEANYRLALELSGNSAVVPLPQGASDNTTTTNSVSAGTRGSIGGVPFPLIRPSDVPNRPSRRIVVIDAGHGGRDPGARAASSGTLEKNITLAAAREFRDALTQRGYEVVLTRDSDIYIPLRERPQRGRAELGDLFISLHADSSSNRETRGASVYTLSQTASDRESEALAKRENESDLVAGIEINAQDDEVRDILLDLTMRRTLNESNRFAQILVEELREDWRVLPRRPQRSAGFAVLTSADMPSVLVEMGFLTNASDVQALASRNSRQGVIRALADAVDEYFETLGSTF